jgi:hypothetical protein
VQTNLRDSQPVQSVNELLQQSGVHDNPENQSSFVDIDNFLGRPRDSNPVFCNQTLDDLGCLFFMKRNHKLIATRLVHQVQRLDFLVGLPTTEKLYIDP